MNTISRLKSFRCLFLLIFIAGGFYGSHYAHAFNFSEVDNKRVLSMYVDSNNMLWYAHQDAIYQYNGKTATRFFHFDKPDHHVVGLTMDDKGKMWMLLDYDLYSIDTTQSNIQATPINQIPPGDDKKTNLHLIYLDKHNRLWAPDATGRIFILQQNQLQQIPFEEDKHCRSYWQIAPFFAENEDGLWMRTQCHVYRFDEQNNRFIKQSLDPSGKRTLTAIDQTKAGLLVSSLNTIYKFDPAQKQFVATGCAIDKSLQRHTVISSFTALDQTLLQITTNNGLLSCDLSTGKNRWFKHINAQDTALGSNMLNLVKSSDQGDLWVAGDTSLQHANVADILFERLHLDSPAKKRLNGNYVLSIVETDKNSVWIGTRQGLNHYDRQQDLVTGYQHQTQNKDSLFGKEVWSLHHLSPNTLLIGTNQGVNQLDLPSMTFKHRSNTPHWPLANIKARVWDMLRQDNILWLASYGAGLYKYDLTTEKLTLYHHDRNDPTGLPDNNLRKLYLAKDGKLWIGAAKGLYEFDQTSNRFRTWYQDSIYDILELPDGRFLFSTGDLYEINKATEQVTLFKPDGKSLVGAKLVVDAQQNLWFSRGYGAISLLDHNNRYFGDPIPKLRASGFITNVGHAGQSGTVYFGAGSGLYFFTPKIPPDSATPPKVLYTQVATFSGKQLNYTDLSIFETAKEIVLPPGDPGVTFKFTTVDHNRTLPVRYRYKLHGFDSTYTLIDNNETTTRYTNLPPGDYRFEVAADNVSSSFTDHSSTFNLVVLPYFWQTNWFKVIMVFALILTVILLLWWRTRALNQRTLILEQQVSQRTKEISELLSAKEQLIANVSHEFRTPLTLIQGPAGLIAEQSGDRALVIKQAGVIQRNSQRLLRMVEHLLMFSKPKQQEQHLSAVKPDALLKVFAEPFVLLAQKQQLTLMIEVEHSDSAIKLPTEALEKIVTNLLSNAVKYNQPEGQIRLHSTHDEKRWQMSVHDSGIGIGDEQLEHIFERFSRLSSAQHEKVSGAGLGLALVKELVDSYEGQIAVTSELGKGSCFTVSFNTVALETEDTDNDSTIDQQQLQLAVDSAEKLPELAQTQPVAITQSATSILIVEDNPDMCRYIESILTCDYQILIAQDGQAGLALAQKELPDMIISDVMMPKMDGFELCRQIKQALPTCHIPVILLTALSDVQDRISGYQSLADEYLNKPFNPQELTARVQNLLAIRSLLHQQLAEDKLLKKPVRENSLNEKDQKFLQQVTLMIDDNYADSEFGAKQLYRKMAMSERLFQRKLKALTGRTPVEHIREKRLQQSAELLQQGHHVGVIADKVGFTSHAYFSSCFKARFGMTPSDYAK